MRLSIVSDIVVNIPRASAVYGKSRLEYPRANELTTFESIPLVERANSRRTRTNGRYSFVNDARG